MKVLAAPRDIRAGVLTPVIRRLRLKESARDRPMPLALPTERALATQPEGGDATTP